VSIAYEIFAYVGDLSAVNRKSTGLASGGSYLHLCLGHRISYDLAAFDGLGGLVRNSVSVESPLLLLLLLLLLLSGFEIFVDLPISVFAGLVGR
jgi:hypothetical protein